MKSIFITGASAGIGKATAILFADKGWFVGVSDINASGLEELKKITGRKIGYAAALDVTDAQNTFSVLKEFNSAAGGRMDVLFNNAGIFRLGPFEEISLKDHHAILNINAAGMINCTYHAFPYLKNTKGSRVINMSSVASIIGCPTEATYSASKFGVRGFTEALNIEWQRHGIHVCDIMPCFVKTTMVEQNTGKFVDNVGVYITAEQVAATVLRAAEHKRLHWVMDRPQNKLFYRCRGFIPDAWERFVLRKMAGI
ncbi:MAG: SDR family oxidoreductase [Smithella sp.]|nr:SDR family oxidoreductase [Smithella sp.]